MAEEIKNEQQDDSTEADTTTPDVKSIDPEDQTFWEDSVDANSVDIAEGQTPPKEATEEKESVAEMDADQEETQTEEETAAADTPPGEETPAPEEEPQQPDGDEKEASTTQTEDADSTSPTPPEDEGEDQPVENEPVAEIEADQEETQTEEETAAADTPPGEEAPVPGEEPQQPDGDEKEASTTQAKDADSTSPTPPEDEGENQPAETEPAAEIEADQEETQTEEETAAADTPPGEETPAPEEEPQPRGKVLSFYRRLNKKTLIAGSGILLLIAGSIGFTVIPGLRSSDTITSTFPGESPETAYDMKFFLPLDVGYEKSQFVKVTIALELMDEGLQKEIDKNISQLRKEVIDLILSKSPKEVKSSDGKKELSQEITTKLNNYLLKDCIKDTYFTELVIL